MLTGIELCKIFKKNTILNCSGLVQQPVTFQSLLADIPVNLWGRDLLMQWGASVPNSTIPSQAKQTMANMGYNAVQNTRAF